MQVDARHRYGHNLRPYYTHWLQLDTHQPFFYWYYSCSLSFLCSELNQSEFIVLVFGRLDVGDGRFVELPKCSRVTLSQQMINYLSPVILFSYISGQFLVVLFMTLALLILVRRLKMVN